MASGKRESVTKTRTVKVEQKYEEDVIKLELTEEEAFALYILLNRVGGARSGPRGQLDKVRYALDQAGISWGPEISKANSKVNGYPIFPDTF